MVRLSKKVISSIYLLLAIPVWVRVGLVYDFETLLVYIIALCYTGYILIFFLLDEPFFFYRWLTPSENHIFRIYAVLFALLGWLSLSVIPFFN